MNKQPEDRRSSETGNEDTENLQTPANDDNTEAPDVADAFAQDREAFMNLVEENKTLNDRALRLAAEMENLRKRTARDVHDARAYSIAGFARDMLGVADNLRRALDAVPEDALKSNDPGLKGLIEGVEMTARDMLGALERHGVKKLNPKGSKFDPHFHQAMFEVPNEQVPNNTVVEVVQEGYVIGDRVLRPAMVGVAKGGPRETPGAGSAETSTEPGPPNPQAERDA